MGEENPSDRGTDSESSADHAPRSLPFRYSAKKHYLDTLLLLLDQLVTVVELAQLAGEYQWTQLGVVLGWYLSSRFTVPFVIVKKFKTPPPGPFESALRWIGGGAVGMSIDAYRGKSWTREHCPRHCIYRILDMAGRTLPITMIELPAAERALTTRFVDQGGASMLLRTFIAYHTFYWGWTVGCQIALHSPSAQWRGTFILVCYSAVDFALFAFTLSSCSIYFGYPAVAVWFLCVTGARIMSRNGIQAWYGDERDPWTRSVLLGTAEVFYSLAAMFFRPDAAILSAGPMLSYEFWRAVSHRWLDMILLLFVCGVFPAPRNLRVMRIDSQSVLLSVAWFRFAVLLQSFLPFSLMLLWSHAYTAIALASNTFPSLQFLAPIIVLRPRGVMDVSSWCQGNSSARKQHASASDRKLLTVQHGTRNQHSSPRLRKGEAMSDLDSLESHGDLWNDLVLVRSDPRNFRARFVAGLEQEKDARTRSNASMSPGSVTHKNGSTAAFKRRGSAWASISRRFSLAITAKYREKSAASDVIDVSMECSPAVGTGSRQRRPDPGPMHRQKPAQDSLQRPLDVSCSIPDDSDFLQYDPLRGP